jgi:hypothetical protein
MSNIVCRFDTSQAHSQAYHTYSQASQACRHTWAKQRHTKTTSSNPDCNGTGHSSGFIEQGTVKPFYLLYTTCFLIQLLDFNKSRRREKFLMNMKSWGIRIVKVRLRTFFTFFVLRTKSAFLHQPRQFMILCKSFV